MSKFFNHNWLEQLAKTTIDMGEGRNAIVKTTRPNHEFITNQPYPYPNKWTTYVQHPDCNMYYTSEYDYAEDLYDAWDMHNEAVERVMSGAYEKDWVTESDYPFTDK